MPTGSSSPTGDPEHLRGKLPDRGLKIASGPGCTAVATWMLAGAFGRVKIAVAGTIINTGATGAFMCVEHALGRFPSMQALGLAAKILWKVPETCRA